MYLESTTKEREKNKCLKAVCCPLAEESCNQATENELLETDKLACLGILVSGVAHDINNPNSFTMVNSSLLKDIWKDTQPILEHCYQEKGDFMLGGLPYSEMQQEINGLLQGIENGSRRINDIVQALRDYAQREWNQVNEDLQINEVIQNAVCLTQNMIKSCCRNFSVDYGENLPAIKGNFQRLEHVLISLLHNACEATIDPAGCIRVSSHLKENEINICIKDQGVGIPESLLQCITTPFFTTKRDKGGTGLGLAVAQRIVKEHGGRLEVESEEDRGSSFQVILPCSAE